MSWENDDFILDPRYGPPQPNWRSLGAYRQASRHGLKNRMPANVEKHMMEMMVGPHSMPMRMRGMLPRGAPIGLEHAIQMRTIRGRAPALKRAAREAADRAAIAATIAAQAERDAAIAAAVAEQANARSAKSKKTTRRKKFYNSNSNSNRSRSGSR